MAYTTNPHVPKVRMQAVNLFYEGWAVRKVARHFGVSPGAISKWKAKDHSYGLRPIPTRSSRPHSHPQALPQEIVDNIVRLRMRHHRCAEVIHQELLNQGVSVSLSSVKRTLERKELIRARSPWKRWHFSEACPAVEQPGSLVQIDTIHFIPGELYVYTLLDVFSRWAWARVSGRINTHRSLRFVSDAKRVFPASFSTLQSDHGPEFSTWFTEHISKQGIVHRHSRVRKPSDNGHLERFNRTI